MITICYAHMKIFVLYMRNISYIYYYYYSYFSASYNYYLCAPNNMESKQGILQKSDSHLK